MLKAILFDLDGTIADTNTLIYESFRHTFQAHDILRVTDDEIYSFFGEPLLQSMQRYAPEQAEELVETYRVYNASIHDDMIRHFPGVRDTLIALREMGLELGIVTSKKGEVARRSINALDLTDFFRIIITPEDTPRHKPEPDPVLHAVRLLGLEPGQCMMVGDSPYDLLAGRAAGALTCGVEYTRLDLNILKQTNPDYMISEVEELLPIVRRLNGDNA